MTLTVTTAMPTASSLPPALLVAEQIQRNRRAWLLEVTLITAALGLAGLLLGVLLALVAGAGGAAVGGGLGVGLAAAVLVANLVPGLGAQAALERAGAQPSDPERHPRLHNLTRGLCEQAGLPEPRLYVVDSPAANAFAVGRDPSRSAIVVTRGLLEALNRVELEGVVAHELAHIHNRGARLASATVILGRLPRMLALGAQPRRLLDADESASYLTRYPPGLAGALRKLGDAAGLLPGRPGLDHLWLVAPQPPSPGAAPTHPPLEERIAALREF